MSASSQVKRRFGLVLTATLLAIGAPFMAPVGTAAAEEIDAAGFVTSAHVGLAQATVGQSVAVTVSVQSDVTRRALVDVEVYDQSGRRAHQKYWDNRSFTAGLTRQFTTAWLTSGLAAGPYTVKVGVFGAGWTPFIHWNNDAADVTLVVGAPTSTTTTTTTQPPAATTTTTTTTTQPTTTTTAPPPSEKFTTLPVGAALPSGAQCSARVRPAAEIRPENATANNRRGSRANANSRTDWSGFNRVDGDFVGTTDQIIQWAACKWGIDEDIVRAQILKESYWYQSANGDNGESWGLGQVRDTAHQSAFQYSVNARTSSAYNLDYTYASWRACYEGVYTWLNTVEHVGTYGAGDVWGCIGTWFSGRWYVNTDSYLNQTGDSVRWHFNNKTWLTSTFING